MLVGYTYYSNLMKEQVYSVICIEKKSVTVVMISIIAAVNVVV
jgi:hypothetical protein